MLRYTTAHTSLGALLVAATDRGVRHVALGDEAATLEAALLGENGAARRDDDGLVAWVRPIRAYLAGGAETPRTPLDLDGTDFQRRVWAALCAIPYGETRTYAALAEAVAGVEAVRAVAGACARNRAALVVPCHRVVRTDGGLGGYRWGLHRKARLLALEAEAYAPTLF